jgi:hypothetical protein
MVSGADNEPPAVGDPGKLGRGQPVAALGDFDKTPPERERSVRETCSASNPIKNPFLCHACNSFSYSVF